MKTQNLKQNTDSWLSFKKSRIGSSEIFGLIRYYCTPEELQNAGIDSDKFNDDPYITAYQLYHKLKNPALYIEPEFNYMLSKFGYKIEKFVLDHLQKEKKYNSTYKKGSVVADDIKIASIDIEGRADSSQIIKDSNDYDISLADTPEFIVESKGVSVFKSKKDKIEIVGVDWKFIFQLQYQLLCSGKKWGKIIAVALNKDNLFERGYISGLSNAKALKYIGENSKIYEFVHIARPEYQYLIESALEKFQIDLKTNQEPKLPDYNEVFYRNHTLFYNLVSQKGQILETGDQVLETDKFDFYFRIKKIEKRFKEKYHKIHQDVRELMLKTGKGCVQGSAGKIVMHGNALKGYGNKENE